MLRQLALWFILGLLLSQCNSASELGVKPADLIDEDKMAAILTEVHLSEARIAKLGISSSDTSSLLFNRLQTQTLKKFNVDTTNYTQSFVYYSARPARLSKIYEQVVDKLKSIEKSKAAKAGKKKPTITP